MADEKTDRQGKLIYVPELQVMAACDEQLELLEPKACYRVLLWLSGKYAPQYLTFDLASLKKPGEYVLNASD